MATPAQAGYGGEDQNPTAAAAAAAGEAAAGEGHGEEEQPVPPQRLKARALLEPIWVQILLFVCTFVALFSEDVRLLCAKGADPVFHAITVIVFVAFLVELAVNVYGFRGENWFYTALDGVATFSLILDFWFVQDAMAGTAIDPLVNQFQNATGPEESAVVDSLVLTRASRAARAGTKIGRLVKLTRLLRVGKMVSLASKARAKKDDAAEDEASDMSRRMAEIITGKVIVIVLVMLFLMPFLELETVDEFPEYGLDVLDTSARLETNVTKKQALIDDYLDQADLAGGTPPRVRSPLLPTSRASSQSLS